MASGSIRKREGKRGIAYEVRVTTGYDPVTGKQKQGTKTCRTKREAETELARMLAAVSDGTFVPDTKMTVAELFSLWLDVLRGTNPKPRTVIEYERTINTSIIPNIGSVTVQKVQPATVDALYATLRAAGASDDKYIGCTSVSHRRSTMPRSGAVSR